MLQPRLCRPSVASDSYLTALASSLNSLSLCPVHAARSRHAPVPFATTVRHASHASQGRANGPKDSAGRRLGAKKGASEYVIPGNIIFKQRGTKWFPGENVGMGKDHTIYSTVQGYVCYYRDPLRHPKRRYIGVALEREGKHSQLPTPANAPSRRRLGMYAVPISGTEREVDSPKAFLESHMSDSSVPSNPDISADPVRRSPPLSRRARREAAILRNGPPAPILRAGGFREANYSIGRADQGRREAKDFDRSDRWTAWHKRAKKVQAKALARAAKAAGKTKGKKKVVKKAKAKK